MHAQTFSDSWKAYHLYGALFGMEDDDFIYPPDLLGSIDFERDHVATYDPQLSLPNPGPNLVVRPLRRSDYNKGIYVRLFVKTSYISDNFLL